jgi:hypothetical protein
MNWDGCGRKQFWPNMRYYHGICLVGLRNVTKILRKESRHRSRDVNPRPPYYEAGLLPTLPRVRCCNTRNHELQLSVYFANCSRVEMYLKDTSPVGCDNSKGPTIIATHEYMNVEW